MSQRTMEAHYRPNWELTQSVGLLGYNCGYAPAHRVESFNEHQKSLVWQLIGDTRVPPGATVVDVGSGIGGPSEWIFDKYLPGRVVGVEYLQHSVFAANDRQRGKQGRPIFVQGDAHKLPFASGSVDVIFNLESALHYPSKDHFIGECRRVLKSDGTLCLGDITAKRKWLFAPIEMLNKLPSQFNSNVHLWSAIDYKNAFRNHGFELLRHEDASLPVAKSLADGLAELKPRGWRGTKGYRGRIGFLAVLEIMLRKGLLSYDLFRCRPTGMA